MPTLNGDVTTPLGIDIGMFYFFGTCNRASMDITVDVNPNDIINVKYSVINSGDGNWRDVRKKFYDAVSGRAVLATCAATGPAAAPCIVLGAMALDIGNKFFGNRDGVVADGQISVNQKWLVEEVYKPERGFFHGHYNHTWSKSTYNVEFMYFRGTPKAEDLAPGYLRK